MFYSNVELHSTIQFKITLQIKRVTHYIKRVFAFILFKQKTTINQQQKKLNVLFIIIMCEINKVFRIRFLKDYRNNLI